MSPAHRRYLLLEQGVGSGVFNFVLNGAIAWVLFRTQAEVPLWGQQSIMGDTIATCFLLPLITCLIVTRLARGHVRTGKVAPLASHAPPTWVPRGTGRRGAALGVACVALLAPLALAALVLVGVASLPFWRFVLFKAGFAAVAATLVTPLIALWAIAEATAPATDHTLRTV